MATVHIQGRHFKFPVRCFCCEVRYLSWVHLVINFREIPSKFPSLVLVNMHNSTSSGRALKSSWHCFINTSLSVAHLLASWLPWLLISLSWTQTFAHPHLWSHACRPINQYLGCDSSLPLKPETYCFTLVMAPPQCYIKSFFFCYQPVLYCTVA